MAALSWSEPESGYRCVSCGKPIGVTLSRFGSVHCDECRHGRTQRLSFWGRRGAERHPRRGSPVARSPKQ
jgi:DNA-directed RNA polymerase subunit RPC12/RpoP